LRELFDYVVESLAARVDDVKTDDGKTLSFFSAGREFLTFNVGRKDVRVYVHPPAGARFKPGETFEVGRFRFWDGSFHKATGEYRALSFWVSAPSDMAGAREIIDRISKRTEGG
jgi:hypothetical protein